MTELEGREDLRTSIYQNCIKETAVLTLLCPPVPSERHILVVLKAIEQQGEVRGQDRLGGCIHSPSPPSAAWQVGPAHN